MGYVLNLELPFRPCVNEVLSLNSPSIIKLHKRAGLSLPELEKTDLGSELWVPFLPLVEQPQTGPSPRALKQGYRLVRITGKGKLKECRHHVDMCRHVQLGDTLLFIGLIHI